MSKVIYAYTRTYMTLQMVDLLKSVQKIKKTEKEKEKKKNKTHVGYLFLRMKKIVTFELY